jgi:hypothetical protein
MRVIGEKKITWPLDIVAAVFLVIQKSLLNIAFLGGNENTLKLQRLKN